MKNIMTCENGICSPCRAVGKLVLGLVLIGWALWYPSVDWRLVVGGLFALKGVLKLIKPSCGHCK